MTAALTATQVFIPDTLPNVQEIQAGIRYVYVRTRNAVHYVFIKLEGAAKDFMSSVASNYDEDAKLLEISNKKFLKGGFLGFEESEKFINSILNAKS